MLSCDNMQSAGNTTASMVLQFLEAAKVDSEVLDYMVAGQVSFPNAMVHVALVPGTNEQTKTQVEQIRARPDEAPVPAGAFTDCWAWRITSQPAAPRGRPRPASPSPKRSSSTSW